MTDNLHLDNALLFDTSAEGFNPGDFVCEGMQSLESLSTPYEVSLDLVCRIDGGVSPTAADELLVGNCQVSYGPGGIHRISGVLRELERVDIHPSGTVSRYRAVMVPRFWLSTLSYRSRVFNELNIPGILEEVLAEMSLVAGTDYELRLVGDYPVREYVVQYEETDFAFMSRWMERLGIFYFFEQTDNGEKLIIADNNSELLEVIDNPACTYGTSAGGPGAVGAVHEMRRRHRRMPLTQYVGDFNWRTPQRRVSAEVPIDENYGVGLVAHYGDHFKDDDQGELYAQVRAEALMVHKTHFRGWTSNPDFKPGQRFSLTGSPMGELDIEYLITSVEHQAVQHGDGAGSGSYRNDVQAIPYDVQYRAPRHTRWPRIDGVMTAKIDAESVSSAAPVDDDGRYQVVMPYDLGGEHGGKATRWIRKAEPYSGPQYGMHFSLHVGTEVLLAHIGGDPDRPVIIGAVPNPTTSSPLTRSNSTRSAIRTRSGILIDFEDDA